MAKRPEAEFPLGKSVTAGVRASSVSLGAGRKPYVRKDEYGWTAYWPIPGKAKEGYAGPFRTQREALDHIKEAKGGPPNRARVKGAKTRWEVFFDNGGSEERVKWTLPATNKVTLPAVPTADDVLAALGPARDHVAWKVDPGMRPAVADARKHAVSIRSDLIHVSAPGGVYGFVLYPVGA